MPCRIFDRVVVSVCLAFAMTGYAGVRPRKMKLLAVLLGSLCDFLIDRASCAALLPLAGGTCLLGHWPRRLISCASALVKAFVPSFPSKSAVRLPGSFRRASSDASINVAAEQNFASVCLRPSQSRSMPQKESATPDSPCPVRQYPAPSRAAPGPCNAHRPR